jgi:2-polyprenyl-3-methyl-5-hydroxy-6-metoxy-1,4-benzoquinol methylase
MNNYNCRACGSSRLEEVLDMGKMPLAGDFKPLGEANKLYPLEIDVCTECGVLQVRQVVPHSVIFNDNYCYASSTISGLVRHFQDYAKTVSIKGQQTKRLLEIGCNDGIFLEPLIQEGYVVVGVDASDNVAELARKRGFIVETAEFTLSSAKTISAKHGLFDVVTCSNVFAHNPDVNGFLDGLCEVLSPNGEFWVEVHSAQELYSQLQWDCFYHEHCFYWTADALISCLAKRGFSVLEQKFTNMHGGAIRIRFQRNQLIRIVTNCKPIDWSDFSVRCKKNRLLIRDVVEKLKLKCAYGIAGRAVTLINWCNLDEDLEYGVDGSPLRAGKAVPNTNMQIISESEYKQENRGDWCFVTAHNYLNDIKTKVSAWFPDKCMKFVTPLPHVTIS